MLAAVILTTAGPARSESWPWSQCYPGGYTVCSSPNVTAHNNANRLTYPEVIMIFWEDDPTDQTPNNPGTYQFSQNKTTPSEDAFIAMTLAVANGPYLDAAAQYGSMKSGNNWGSGWIGRTRVSPFAALYQGKVLTTGHNTTVANIDDIQTIIQNEISIGAVPGTYPGSSNIYIVFTPTSAVSYCGRNGCNDYIPQGRFGAPYDVLQIEVNSGNPGETLTHELVEAVSNWESVFADNCYNTNNGMTTYAQIADLCNNCSAQHDEVNQQAYWSQADQMCIVPASAQPLQVNTLANGWTQPTGGPSPLRQVSGGAEGVVATDDSIDAWFYSASTGWTGPLAGMGSQVSAGGLNATTGIIAGIGSASAATLSVYPLGNSNGYFHLSPPSGVHFTGVYVTSANTIIATDNFGHPWEWCSAQPPTSSGSWVAFADGNTFDQLLAVNGTVVGQTMDRTKVLQYSSTDLYYCHGNVAWTTVPNFNNASYLVGTPDSGYFGEVSPSGFSGSDGTSYTPVYGGGANYAVSNAGTRYQEVRYIGIMNSGTGTFNTQIQYTGRPPFGNSNFSWGQGVRKGGRVISGWDMFMTDCTNPPMCVNY